MDLANHYIAQTLHSAAAERGAQALAAIADEDDERLCRPEPRRHAWFHGTTAGRARAAH